jgi:hypothetical protein
MEPRKIIGASADVVRKTEGRVDTLNVRAWRIELAGVEERGMHTGGFPRNLGDLLVSTPPDREGPPMKQSRPRGRASDRSSEPMI